MNTRSRTSGTPFADRVAFVSVLFFCRLDILSLFLSFPRHVAWIVMECSRLLFSRPLLVWILIVTHGMAPMNVPTSLGRRPYATFVPWLYAARPPASLGPRGLDIPKQDAIG
jgi:hypothetical protein